jgi:4-diphosphocytidyl-2-C-methyl-D-erythritol kinase
VRALAPGKVNLCLFLGGPRDDGRHELVTLLESVSLADELELTVLPDAAAGDEVVCVGVEGPNLVADALSGLRGQGWDGPFVRIEIVKRIPVAAGMGGGSADAAAALRMVTQLAPRRPEEISLLAPRMPEEIARLAASLGADVPSQLAPGLVLGTGAGELVEPLAPLAPHAFVILPQPVALSTADVYVEADRLGLTRSAADLGASAAALRAELRPGLELPGDLIHNDLEPAALSLCPAIAPALAEARAVGADQAIVSGSGPTVAGLFWGPDAPDRAAAAREALASRFPGVHAVVPVSGDFGMPRVA